MVSARYRGSKRRGAGEHFLPFTLIFLHDDARQHSLRLEGQCASRRQMLAHCRKETMTPVKKNQGLYSYSLQTLCMPLGF
jgi:hypothetical protein